MKVTVIEFDAVETREARNRLTNQKKLIDDFRRDLNDNRIDAETIRDFVEGLRVTAACFEQFVGDDVPLVEFDEVP